MVAGTGKSPDFGKRLFCLHKQLHVFIFVVLEGNTREIFTPPLWLRQKTRFWYDKEKNCQPEVNT
jgi:hypothetical protein